MTLALPHEVRLDGRVAHAGFRGPAAALAGGPIEIEFFVENLGAESLWFQAIGDRGRQRPADVVLRARLGGLVLDDPCSGADDYGGFGGSLEVAPGTTRVLPLLLNDFSTVERLPALLGPGQGAALEVDCRRVLHIGQSIQSANFPRQPGALVEDRIAIRVTRDDDALTVLVTQFAEQVERGSAATREDSLAKLLVLRLPQIHPILERLAIHSDPTLAARARSELARAGHRP